MNNFPLAQALPKIFAGSGECAKVQLALPRPVDPGVGAGLVRDPPRPRDLGRLRAQAMSADPSRLARRAFLARAAALAAAALLRPSPRAPAPGALHRRSVHPGRRLRLAAHRQRRAVDAPRARAARGRRHRARARVDGALGDRGGREVRAHRQPRRARHATRRERARGARRGRRARSPRAGTSTASSPATRRAPWAARAPRPRRAAATSACAWCSRPASSTSRATSPRTATSPPRTPDLVAFVGDYIYESSWGREHVRKHAGGEPHTLDDYRNRYALYKTDARPAGARTPPRRGSSPGTTTRSTTTTPNDRSEDLDPGFPRAPRRRLPRVLRAHAAARLGAARGRRHAHLRRASTGARSRRSTARRPPVPLAPGLPEGRGAAAATWSAPSAPSAWTPACTLLGAAQERWLDEGLAQSRARWNLIAQQTLFAPAGRIARPGPRALDRRLGRLPRGARAAPRLARRAQARPTR